MCIRDRGHIHKSNYEKISETSNNTKAINNIIYPGSTVAIGFDEQGEHGVIEGEFNNKELTLKFIPLDDKKFIVINLDAVSYTHLFLCWK